MLHGMEKWVCIETNGTLPTPKNADWIVCSPKPPEYKMHEECNYHELKFVVDEHFSVDQIPQDLLKMPVGTIWLQPESSIMQKSWRRCYNLAMAHTCFRVGLQLHRLIDVK